MKPSRELIAAAVAAVVVTVVDVAVVAVVVVTAVAAAVIAITIVTNANRAGNGSGHGFIQIRGLLPRFGFYLQTQSFSPT